MDEGCCPWKGRLRFRQYNPRKPAKFHIKLFQVSDPATGYVIHFQCTLERDRVIVKVSSQITLAYKILQQKQS